MKLPASSTGITDLLSRRSSHLERNNSSNDVGLTESQKMVDGLVEGFVRQATDLRTLTPLVTGGMAYRLGRVGMMSLGSGNAIRALSVGMGLGTEVSVFELTHRSLLTLPFTSPLSSFERGIKGETERNLWRWSGPQGLKEGLLTSFVTFATLKGLGSLTQGENLILQHGSQTTGMVLGHQLVYEGGWGLKPEGTLADQFFHAEATNLQLIAGMPLGHALTGGRLIALEKGMDLFLYSKKGDHEEKRTSLLLSFHPSSAVAKAGKEGFSGLFQKKEEVLWKATRKKVEEEGVFFSTLPKIHRTRSQQRALQKARQLVELIGREEEFEKSGGELALKSITSRLAPLDRLALAFKVEERLGDPDEVVRLEAAWNLGAWIAPELEPSDRLPLSLKILERLVGPPDVDVEWRAAFLTLHHMLLNCEFELSDSMTFLAKMMDRGNLDHPYPDFVNLILQRIPPEALLGFAQAQGREDLEQLASYHQAGLPFLPYFWLPYLQARDRDLYLKNTKKEIEPYLRGKPLSTFDERELHLAYAGLDGSEGIPFDYFHDPVLGSFRAGIRYETIPPPFLKRSFQTSIGEIHSVEFIPSKSQVDAFFRSGGEDVMEFLANCIYEEDFQVYRMLTNGRLSGMLYLQKANIDQIEVLVMAIQPRLFWKVDHRALLKVIEENIGKIASLEGYDAVFLMGVQDQQSNHEGMLKAIEERRYASVFSSQGIPGHIFEGNRFLVMWKRNTSLIN